VDGRERVTAHAKRKYSYVTQFPYRHAVLAPYEMLDVQMLAPHSASLNALLRTLTPEQSTWLFDVVNLVQREGYRKGAKAAADSD